ncbi:MAG: hypothetical protein M3O36_09790 [Myxococcota bacterium]|nr:hypothetical protein [Myxococcota bacterium]
MTKPLETGANDGSPAAHSNAARPKGPSHIGWGGMRRRAKNLVGQLPDIGRKQSFYAGIGVSAAVGLGVGILLGSRILRAVLASTVSYAVVEVSRTLVREWMASGREAPVTPAPRTANAGQG